MHLFPEQNLLRQLPLPDAELYFAPHFFPLQPSNFYFEELQKNIAWKQENIKLYGKQIAQAYRLVRRRRKSHYLFGPNPTTPTLDQRFTRNKNRSRKSR